MKANNDILASVLKTTQMGQIGIRSALDISMKKDLRQAMESQLREYDIIEKEAKDIAEKKRWKLKEVNPSVRFMTDRMTKMKLSFGDVNGKIAAMMIRGNMSGEIKGLKNMHQLTNADKEVSALANKLLETENRNIQQMKPYL